MTTDRLNQARQSGKSPKDLQLLMDQDARMQEERSDAATSLDEKLIRLKAQRLAHAADMAKKPAKTSAKTQGKEKKRS